MQPLSWLAVLTVSAAATAVPVSQPSGVTENEAATLDDIRTVIDAAASYQAVNGGYFDQLECLAAPETCIPFYKGPPMLSRELADMVNRSGYRRSFHDGPYPPDGTPSKCSPSSLTAYAYVAVPVRPGVTGVRSFCGDGTGRICYKTDGSAPKVVDGLCPEDCLSARARGDEAGIEVGSGCGMGHDVGVAPDHPLSHSGVGGVHPGRDYLWILARNPKMAEATYQSIITRLRAQGYEPPPRLVRTLQVARPPAASGARAPERS